MTGLFRRFANSRGMEILQLYDAERERPVPVAVYQPQGPRLGWLLFSVGFGGSCTGYAYLGRAWSRLGFEVVVVEHVGSNAEVMKAIHRPGMRQAELAEIVGVRAREPEEMKARPIDLDFVRRHFCSANDWVGVAGHSFGSYTALAALGAEMQLPEGEYRWTFPYSWQAAVLLSPPPPDTVVTRRGLGEVALPCLMLTGTRDSGMPAGVTYEQRRQAYDFLPPGRKFSAVLQGADHMSMAAIGLAVAPVVETIAGLTSEFWLAVYSGRSPQWPVGLALEVEFEAA